MKKVYSSFTKVLALLICLSLATTQSLYAQCVLQGTIADPGCGGTVNTNNVGGGQSWTLTSVIGADYTLSISGSNTCGTYTASPSSFTAASTSSSVNILAGGSCCWASGGSAVLTYTEVAYTNTTSNANICQGTTRPLTVSPAPFTAGTWSVIAGTGTGSIAGTTFTAGTPGTVTIRYTKGSCNSDVAVTIIGAPTTATVGSNQSVCGLTSTSLGGNTPAVGTGTWTQTAGPGSTVFSSANSGSSTATVTAYGTYTYQWSIANGICTPSTASLTVTYSQTPTAATVGATQNICGSFVSAALGGNTPAVGTGTWTQISGPSAAVFSNANSGSSTATVSATGAYVFKWTIANGACASSSATVTVNYYGTPTTASTGGTQNICGSLTSGSLGGNSPAVGSGAWSQTSGPGSTAFSNSLSPSATATATIPGTYVYTWTISNGTCTPSTASVTVNFYATPTTATVGATQNVCGSLTTASLGGNTPVAGTGTWTQTSGPGSTVFSNASTGSSTATASVIGTYTYQWTISNGTCTPSSASLTVNYYNNPTLATVGADQDTCGSLTSLPLGGNTPVIGTGAWSQTAGAGVTFFSAASSGSSTASVSVPGAYTFTWTITNGTCTSTASINVNFYGTPTIATVGSDESVCGLTSNNLGGNTPAVGTGAWSQTSGPGTTLFSNPTSGSSTATASIVGTYVYTWTISNGTCVPSTASITVNYITTPSGGNIPNASYCSSVGTGSVSVVGVSNATQYSWALPGGLSGSSTASTITVGGSLVGTYTVTVTPQDVAFGVTCSGTPVTGTVTILGLPSIDSINAGTLSCYGGSNDTITVYATGSNGNLFYSIDGGTTYTNTTGVFPGLGAGSYNVYVKDDSSCATAYTSNPVKVIAPPDILLSIASYGNVLCNGDSSGYVNLSASGGTGLLTFLWNNSSTSQNISHLASGNFTVTATDQNGCTKSITQGITEPTPLTDSISATNVSCYGANDATATFVVSGGSPAYKFLWSTGDTSQTITNLNGAVYSVTATDNNGCRAVNSVNIINPQPVSVTLNVTNVSCFGNGNGKIVANAAGGTGAYTYTWSPSVSTTSTVTNAAPGNYILTVSDVNNCKAVDSAIVTQPLTGLSLASVVTPIGCTGDSSGAINLLASGGSGGYIYNWSSGQSIQIISGLPAGIYIGSVTDANGCTASLSDTLLTPSPIVSSITKTNVTCYGSHDGTASLTVSGGVAPYSLLWSNFDTTFNIARLANGLYRVRITDAYGCEHSDSVRIRRPADLTGTLAVSNVKCNGSNIDTIIANITGGNAGGYTYTWSPSVSTTATVTNVAPGTYILTVTDSKGCSFTDSATITQPLTAVSVTAITSPVGCSGASNGSINLLASGGVGGYTYSWSSGQSNQIISGLPAAIYVGSVTDANGCVVSLSDTLTDPTPIVSSITKTNVTCFGSNDGTATLTVSGGVAPYSVLWDNFDTTFNITRLSNGLYRVRITDANGCEHSDSVRIRRPADLTGTLSVSNVKCNGSNIDTITANITGGNAGGYTYTWSPSVSTTATVTNVAPGTYILTVTDSRGCTFTDSATITQPLTAVSVTAITSPVGCSGASNGSINLLASGGMGGYTYSWASGQTTQIISGLPAGIYIGSVTDANGCVASLSDTLTDPTPIVSSVTSTNVTCFGGNDATATLTVSGGIAPYSILWDNFDTTNAISGLSSGLYRVRITDANGCEHSDSVVITSPPNLTGTLSVVNVKCNGSNIDTITANITGGNAGGYTYTWSPSVSITSMVTNVAPGTYVLTVTDSRGCSFTDSATITQPLTAVSITAIVDSITCNNASNGSIDVLASGGVGGYTYLWSPGAQTASTITGLSAGSNTVTVTDGNGCTASQTYVLTNPSAITSTVTGVNVTCAGASNGSATLTVSGGTPGYTYLWSNFANTQNLNNIGGGTYRVIITDAHGCQHRDSVVITEPQALSATITVVNVLCFGANTGSVSVAVSGGTPAVGGYTYTWSPIASATNSVSGVGPGTYTVIASDANGCSITASGTVTQPASAVSVLSNVVNVSCGGNSNGSISLSVNGGTPGYTYVWATGQHTQNITGLAAGIYTVTVVDANGCQVVVNDTVKAPTPITSSVAGTNVTCAGAHNGAAALTVSGGALPYTFLWSNFSGAQNIDSLSGGWYYVIITDGNGCEKRDSVKILEPQPLVLADTVSPVSCTNGTNGSIHITSTGGTGSSASFTYTWSPSGPNSPDNTNLSPGSYTVTVADANGCRASLTIQLANPAPLTILHTVTDLRCNNDQSGSINLAAGGGTPGYSYTWTPAGPNLSTNNNLAAGTYQVTVTDSRGCHISDTILVTEPAPMYVSGIQKNVSCHGNGDGYILPTGYGGTQPYSYQWYLGTDTFAPLGPITENLTQLSGGDYYLIITDGHGCMVPFTRHIVEPDSLKAMLTETDIACAGANTGMVKVSVIGGTTPYQYLWNNFTTDSMQTNVTAGTYTVVVTDSNGCHLNKSIVVNQPLPLSLTETQTNLLCNGNTNGTIAITVQGGKNPYTYSWNTIPVQTTATASNLGAGTYTVVVTDSNHCTLTDSYTITSPAALEVNTAISNPTCSGGNNGFVSLDVRGGSAPYSYSWSTTPAQSGNVASALVSNTYYATVTDSKGCTLLDTAVVLAPQPIVVLIGSVSASCTGQAQGTILVNATGGLAPYTFELGGMIQTTDTFINLPAGNYTVEVTDVNGCQGSASTSVAAAGRFTDTLTASPSVILAGEVVHLFANASSDTSIVSYTWFPADSLDFSACGSPSNCNNPTVRPTQTQDYIVTVANARGCTLTDTVRVFVSAQPSAFIPTGFTPNGDGLNDRFEFDILGATTVNVQIWNRWGNLVYSNPAQPNGLNGVDGWDGLFHGQPVAYDTYTYQFDITYFDGHHETRAGTVTIMR